ncbi:hypothetical protein VHEMI00503 [[Torrubiella] hemipterigena]|uniref:Rhodanese domain-containing protein n=1 Tax=[Torrubiella] hemipterigena TaxID=1531966 RepID=A0A0A1SJF6_9HYPO|nr:hypothetical protein VHEMI00503 [[Torrubiella] hemipterigena]
MASRRLTSLCIDAATVTRFVARPASLSALSRFPHASTRVCRNGVSMSRVAQPKATPSQWYSTRSEENTVPGSKIWGFKEMKDQAENHETRTDIVLVDVREPAELIDTGKIPGAINIPITSAVQSFHVSDQDFEDMYGFERPGKDKTLVFYCKAGVRARSAAALAQHAGWNKIGEYPGSWLDWQEQNGPVEKLSSFSSSKKND